MDKQEPSQAAMNAAADFLEAWEPGPEMTVVKLARAFDAFTRANRPADDGLATAIWKSVKRAFFKDASSQEDAIGIMCVTTALRAQSDAEVERIVAWLNQLGDLWSARQIAAMIERGEHRKDGV